MTQTLHLVGDPDADRILSEHPFALLTGMLLDQQIPMEAAFDGPRKIVERLGSVDPAVIASTDPEEFIALCATPPGVPTWISGMVTGELLADSPVTPPSPREVTVNV